MEPARVVYLLRQVCHSLREAHSRDAAWTAGAAREWDLRRVVVDPGEDAVTGTRADATTAPAMGRPAYAASSEPAADATVRVPAASRVADSAR